MLVEVDFRFFYGSRWCICNITHNLLLEVYYVLISLGFIWYISVVSCGCGVLILLYLGRWVFFYLGLGFLSVILW